MLVSYRLERFMGNDASCLEGRVALITGASSNGIGSGAAKKLAAAGAKVFITARREDKLRGIANEIESEGGTVSFMTCDVSVEEQCEAVVAKCVETFGRLDILVLSAGIIGMYCEDVEDEFDTDNWNEVLGTNLTGEFNMIKYGYLECAKGGVGAIVPIASLAAFTSSASLAYTASKGAIKAMTHWLGKHLAPLNIRVNTLYPGMIDTDMTHPAVVMDSFAEPTLAATPLKRFGTIEDCANAILFLASDASSYMTGQDLIVDGGVLCN